MRRFIGATLITAMLSTGVVTVVNVPKADAWDTDETAVAYCLDDGYAYIDVWFFNGEPGDRDDLAMDVVAVDLQSGQSVDLGAVVPQDDGSGTISTGWNELDDGKVRFELTWSDGHGGVDSRRARYSATGDCTPPPTTTTTLPPEVTPPPAAVCPSGILWEHPNPTSRDPKLLNPSSPVLNTGTNVPVGEYVVTSGSWDGYPSRIDVTQLNEQWRVEVGGVATGYTSDVPDKVVSAYVQNNLGTHVFPDGELVLRHIGGNGPGSVIPTSVCLTPVPPPTTTTTTSTVPEPEPTTTTSTVPEPEPTTTTTGAPVCDENHPNWNPTTRICVLPMTGADNGGLALLGLALFMAGGLAILATRKKPGLGN